MYGWNPEAPILFQTTIRLGVIYGLSVAVPLVMHLWGARCARCTEVYTQVRQYAFGARRSAVVYFAILIAHHFASRRRSAEYVPRG